MRPIRVTELIARMNVGGPAVQVAELVRGLDPDEFDVRLVTGWCADDEADYLLTRDPDLPVTRIPDLGRSVRVAADARALAALVADLRRSPPDVLHTHTAKAGTLGRAAVRIARVPTAVVHTFHGHLLTGYFDARTTRAVVQLERTLARRTDRLVAVGTRVRDDLLAARIGRPAQYEVIRPGVAVPSTISREQARGSLGLPPDAVVVAVLGRLARIKRPDRMADVVASVAERGLPVHAVVAGGGDQEDGLRHRVRSRGLPITLVGWQDDPARVLAASDVMLLTSDNEGTPLSLIEGALAGLPAVATAVGSVPEVVVDGVTGWLAPCDASALADRLADLISDPDRRRAMGAAAREHAAGHYGMDRYLAEHARMYAALAGTRIAVRPRLPERFTQLRERGLAR